MVKTADKEELRHFYKALRKNSDPADAARKDKMLCDKLFVLPEYAAADTVLMYYPSKGEPDILKIFGKSRSDGKSVAFPLCAGREMIFKLVNNLSELTTVYFGIPSPSPEAKNAPTGKNTLCILPALAFDRDGFRLGYGGGFYDRFLSGFCGISAGLARSEFLTNYLPRESFDRKADIIITENEVIVTNAQKEPV